MRAHRVVRSLKRKETMTAWLYLLPCIALMSLVILYPTVYGVLLGFTDYSLGETTAPNFTAFQNYRTLFAEDEIFRKAVKNTLIWTAGVVSFQYAIGLIVALLLNVQFTGRWAYRALILLPWVVPNIVSAYMWQWMYDPNYGVVTWILTGIGVLSSERSLLASPNTALYAVMAIAVWRGVPFMTVMLLAGLQGIPRELYEVANLDGANGFQRFRFITFPMLKNISIVCVLLMSIWMFNHFDIPYVLTRGGPRNASMLLVMYTYLRSMRHFNMGYAASIGVFMLAVLMVFAYFYLRVVNRQRGAE